MDGWKIIEQNERIDAELHLVHRSPIDQSLAVIGVLLQAQAKNVPFFKYLTALQRKVHAYHTVSHVEEQQLQDRLSENPFAFIEDDSEGSIAEFADGDEDEEYDEEEDEQEDEKQGDDGEDEDEEVAAEYNAEDETDFSSQDFDAEPDANYEEGESQVGANVNTVETINILDTLDRNTNNQNNKQQNNKNNNNNNNNNRNAKQQLFDVNINGNTNENNNIDNNQYGHQDTNLAAYDAAVFTAAMAAENHKVPPTVDETICTGVPPTDEEATHIDLPLKSVDFSPLVKTVKGFTNRWEYAGSLTTPPCSEHVEWNVMHEPFPIGLEQLRALVDLQGYNARMINEDSQSTRGPVA
jgi:carbonic anhydrase